MWDGDVRFELYGQAAVQRGEGVCDTAEDGEEGTPLLGVWLVVGVLWGGFEGGDWNASQKDEVSVHAL